MSIPLRWLAALYLLFSITACSPRLLVINEVADELSAQSQGDETDLDLAREASAFYLKFSESVLRSNPAHQKLAESVSAGFTQYAYAFVAFDAELIENKDAKAAERMRNRAAGIYRRAHEHAMRALTQQKADFMQVLASANPADWPKLKPEQAGLAYWAAASWGGWISLSKDEPDIVADLPLAIRLAELAWATDPNWGAGALTGLLGTFESARPSSRLPRALEYFDQSIAQAGGRSAGAYLAKAEGYALPTGDRALFEQLLTQALAVKDEAGSAFTLQNEVMRRRARWLQAKTGELF